MKFVKSSLAACAAIIAASAFAAATTDENGLMPTLWYKFEGDGTSYGSKNVTWNNLKTDAGYYETVNGRKALKYNLTGSSTGQKDPYTSKIGDFSTYFGIEGFTIATYCRMSSTKKRATISLGSLKGDYANHELLLATANDDTNVRIFYERASDKKQITAFQVNPGTRTDFHHYAMTFTPAVDESDTSVTNWTVALYVDGVAKAEASSESSRIPGVPTKGGIQLFNVFDDNSMTGYAGGAEGAAIDDLRIYDQVLTETQIKEMSKRAASLPDAKGRTPSVWLTFDGNMNSQGFSTLSWGDAPSKADNYIQTQSGKALYYWSLAEGKHHDPYTTGADVPTILGADGFTIMTSGRMGLPAKKTLFGLGSMKAGSNHELILAQGETLGQVVLVDAIKGAVTTVVSTNVSDCTRVLHHYAVSVAKTEESYTATLYVDGVSAGSGTLSAIPSDGGLQFFNVFADDGSGYSGDLAGAAVDDFRVYTEVLDAETIASYAAEFPASARKDENDSAVDVWMRFDGDYYYSSQSNPYAVIGVEDGLADVGIPSATSWKGTYETSRNGRALQPSTDSYSTAAGMDFGTGDWTIVLSARAQTVSDGKPTCLWTFGKAADTANTLGFFSTADGLMVSTWSNKSLAQNPIFNLTDARLAKSINTYTLVYTKTAGTLELFLNGASQGTVTAPTTAAIQGQVAWQLASLFNGVFGSLTRYNYTGAVDDFRLYKKALTTTEVQTIAAANKAYPMLDENCARPAYWYQFNGNLNGEGTASWTVEGDSGSAQYTTETSGIQAFDVSGLTKTPYGKDIAYGTGGWTVVLRAMGEETDNAVIMGLGDRRSSNALAFAMGGKSRFSVATWSYVDDNTDCPHTDLFNVYLPNAYRQYHDYALVYQPATSAEEGATGTLTLYVDGKCMGSVAKTLTMGGQWQLGNIYSGPAGTGLTAATKARIDDFRVYTEALTVAQIKAIADANPVWPYYAKPFMIIVR